MAREAARVAVYELAEGRSCFVSLVRRRHRHRIAAHVTSPTPNPRSARMSLGYDRPLYILAFDHRTSFATKMFGITGAPTDAERARMAEAKRIIGQGLLAVADTADRSVLGALTDEENGAAAAREAKANGLTLAMAAEKSSQPEFEFEYGDAVRPSTSRRSTPTSSRSSSATTRRATPR